MSSYDHFKRYETGEERSPDDHLDRAIDQLYPDNNDTEQSKPEQPTNAETEEAYNDISNDAAKQQRAFELIARCYEAAELMRLRDPDPVDFYTPRHDAAEALQGWFETASPLERDTSVYRDLLTAAFARVDWLVIVDRLRADDSEITQQEAAALAKLQASEHDDRQSPNL